MDVQQGSQAALTLRAHLQVGRRLRGWPLAVAVALRNLPCAVLSAGSHVDSTTLAPAWVVVEDRGTGAVVRRFPAGRASGAGPALLERVRGELRELTREQFLAQH